MVDNVIYISSRANDRASDGAQTPTHLGEATIGDLNNAKTCRAIYVKSVLLIAFLNTHGPDAPPVPDMRYDLQTDKLTLTFNQASYENCQDFLKHGLSAMTVNVSNILTAIFNKIPADLRGDQDMSFSLNEEGYPQVTLLPSVSRMAPYIIK